MEIANADNIVCIKKGGLMRTHMPLQHHISISWQISLADADQPKKGYSISMQLKQLGSKHAGITFSEIFPIPEIIMSANNETAMNNRTNATVNRQEVTLTIAGKETQMNKFTYKGIPSKEYRIIIFVNRANNQPTLGEINYSPTDPDNSWSIVSEYLDESELALPFIKTYSFFGGRKYVENDDEIELECDLTNAKYPFI
jgi:hypothetical protein